MMPMIVISLLCLLLAGMLLVFLCSECLVIDLHTLTFVHCSQLESSSLCLHSRAMSLLSCVIRSTSLSEQLAFVVLNLSLNEEVIIDSIFFEAEHLKVVLSRVLMAFLVK